VSWRLLSPPAAVPWSLQAPGVPFTNTNAVHRSHHSTPAGALWSWRRCSRGSRRPSSRPSERPASSTGTRAKGERLQRGLVAVAAGWRPVGRQVAAGSEPGGVGGRRRVGRAQSTAALFGARTAAIIARRGTRTAARRGGGGTCGGGAHSPQRASGSTGASDSVPSCAATSLLAVARAES
jgi:hypothetical protein